MATAGGTHLDDMALWRLPFAGARGRTAAESNWMPKSAPISAGSGRVGSAGWDHTGSHGGVEMMSCGGISKVN